MTMARLAIRRPFRQGSRRGPRVTGHRDVSGAAALHLHRATGNVLPDQVPVTSGDGDLYPQGLPIGRVIGNPVTMEVWRPMPTCDLSRAPAHYARSSGVARVGRGGRRLS